MTLERRARGDATSFDDVMVEAGLYRVLLRPIDALPSQRIQQIHVAGHTNCGTHIIDTHDAAVIDEVWKLYSYAIEAFGPVATMIERDDHIPELDVLVSELDQARTLSAQATRLTISA